MITVQETAVVNIRAMQFDCIEHAFKSPSQQIAN